MKRRLVVELLDVVQFAKPGIANLDIELTAQAIIRFKKQGTPRSYNLAFEPLAKISSGLVKRSDITALVNSHPIIEWRPYLLDVALRLHDIFGTFGGTWYPTGRKPIATFSDVWTKPAIRGVAVRGKNAFPCLINPRASLFIHYQKELAFLSRGVHELHVIDDPQAKGMMIIDLGRHPKTKMRENRILFPNEDELMPLEEFEFVLKAFIEAVKLAGFNALPESIYTINDLFRKK